MQRILRDALAAENARWTGPRAARARSSRSSIDTIGIRPTGGQADAAPIVQTALAAGKALGFTSSTTASSTDANIPISSAFRRFASTAAGGAEGAHSLGEWYDDGPNG